MSVKWLKFGILLENIEIQPLRNVLMPSQVLQISVIALTKEKTRYQLLSIKQKATSSLTLQQCQ